MASRTLSIDTPAIVFTFKLLIVLALVVGGWYLWTPLSQTITHAHADRETVAANADDTAVSDMFGAGAADGTNTEALANGMLSYLPQGGRFVVIDLVEQHIVLYEHSAPTATLAIAALPPSAADRPYQGLYTVDSKDEAKVSTVTLARFPYYIVFGDHYAIHGTPTAANGDALTDQSAGDVSLELSGDDAKTLYDFVSAGTPVGVRSDRMEQPATSEATLALALADLPATSGRAYEVADLGTGQVLLSRGNNSRYPIASVTKLITAAVATDLLGTDADVMAPDGQHYTLADLFYPLFLRSDNAVAERIAATAGTRTFIAHMNAYVQALGMTKTSFADSSGLSPHNVSTVDDLVTFARHIYENKPFLLDISKELHMTITSTAGVKWTMDNQNKLAADPHFRGGKLGYTDEAQQTAIAVFDLPLNGRMHTIAVVVLQSKDWKQDARTLLRWVLENVSTSQ